MSTTLACPHCGHPAQGTQTYCGNCGKALPPASVPGGAPPAVYAAYPPPPPPSSGASPWLIAGAVVGGLVTIGLIVVVVLLAANSGTTSATTHQQAAAIPIKPIASSPDGTGGANGGSLVTPSNTNTTPPAPPPLNAPGVTGTDAQGYNIGPGCSDNPSSPQPGCADSPSTPNGDPEGTCPAGITVDRQTTSCGLAENVRAAYRSDGPVVALSPERGRSFAFTCQTGGQGTTHMTICHGQAGESTLYLRW